MLDPRPDAGLPDLGLDYVGLPVLTADPMDRSHPLPWSAEPHGERC